MQSALVGEVDSKLGVGSSVVELLPRMMGRLVVVGVLFMAGSAVHSQRRQGFRGVGVGRRFWGWRGGGFWGFFFGGVGGLTAGV